MNNLDIYRQTAKFVILTTLAILLCKLTKGYITPLFVFLGVWYALANKLGWALVLFVLMPFFVILNPALFPKESPVVGYSLRAGPLLIGFCLAIGGMSRQGRHRLPFISMVPFLMAALISSAGGWAPKVSYLKWINFVVFLFGIWYGTQNLQHRPSDVYLLRCFFLSLCVMLILGSIILMPIPSISYATSLRYALAEGGAELAEETFKHMQSEGLRALFCGITSHSQALSPLLVAAMGFISCDMLFLERRFRWQHMTLIVLVFPLLYLTRSRVALVSGMFVISMVFFYTTRVVKLPENIKNRLGSGIMIFMLFIVLVAVAMQFRTGAISQWVRKTHDTSADRRSLLEAMTASRMGLLEMSLNDFKRNPLLGMGFQVAEYTRTNTKGKGFIVSASIEKGLLPVMVLGEGGILGAICFFVFLTSFYLTCSKRKYYITITTFSILLVTNIGEATFFSPGGVGGILWMMSCVGGFTIDTLLLFRRNIEQGWQNMARTGMPPPVQYGPQRPVRVR